jgi:hypothetical protein
MTLRLRTPICPEHALAETAFCKRSILTDDPECLPKAIMSG